MKGERMPKTQHTETPWHLLPSRTLINIKGPKGEQVCQIPKRDAANADLIVSAVNNHAELLAKCKGMVVWLEQAYPQAVILSRDECLIELRPLRGRRWVFCPRCEGAGAVLVPISARFHSTAKTGKQLDRLIDDILGSRR
jgi:hypothetical protein